MAHANTEFKSARNRGSASLVTECRVNQAYREKGHYWDSAAADIAGGDESDVRFELRTIEDIVC